MDSRQAEQAYHEAEQLFKTQKFHEALELLDDLARQIPAHEAVEFARAQALAMLGRRNEAEALCDTLTPLFGSDGVGQLKQLLRDMELTGGDGLQWGFARPTDEPVTFEGVVDGAAPAMLIRESEDLDSFFAELSAFDLDEPEPIALPGPVAPADTRPDDTAVDDPLPPLEDVHDDLEEPAFVNDPGRSGTYESLEPLEGSGGDLNEFPGSLGRSGISPSSLGELADDLDESPGALEEVGSDVNGSPDALEPLSAGFDESDLPEQNALGALPDLSDATPNDSDDLGPLSPLEDDAELPPPESRPFENTLGSLADLGPIEEGPEAISSGEFFLVDSSGVPLDDRAPEPEPAAAAAAPPSYVHAFEDDEDTQSLNLPPAPPPPPAAPSMVEQAEAVPTFLMAEEPAPPPPPAEASQPPKRSGSKTALLLVLVLLAAGGGAAWYYLRPQPETPGPAPAPTGATADVTPETPPAPAPVAELTWNEFQSLLSQLRPDGDPEAILARLNTVSNIAAWPDADQPAIGLVVDESGRRGGSKAHLQIARALLDRGAAANGATRGGQSLVELAATHNDEPMVRLLLEHGAPATPKLIVWTARTGRLPLAQQILQANPDTATAEALYASVDARQDAITGLLLERKADVQQLLELAVQRGTRHVFRFAVEHGADPEAPGLLKMGIEAQQPAMVELLLQAGVDPRVANTNGQSPIAALEAKTTKTAADQEILRLIQEHTAVLVTSVPSGRGATEPTMPPARDLGVLYARSKQEVKWSPAGAWQGPLHVTPGKIFRIDIAAGNEEDLAPLAELRPGDVYALRLTGPGVTDASLKHVSGLSGIHELEIVGAPISDVGLQQLRALTLLTSLRVTSPPEGPRAQINGAGLSILRPMLHLVHVDFSGTTFGDRALPLLDSLSGLKSLNLSGTEVTDASLGTLRNLRNLEAISFGSGPGLTTKVTGSALYAVRDISELRELHLYGMAMSATGFEVLASLRRLAYLDLRNTGLTEADVSRIAKLKQVADIALGENDLGSDAQKALTSQMPGTRLTF